TQAEASSKESRTRQRDEDQGWNTQSLSTKEAVHVPTPEKTDIKRVMPPVHPTPQDKAGTIRVLSHITPPVPSESWLAFPGYLVPSE
ncbi:hypothetical protein GW17_00016606, partial [Ensete ventricosum]